ncbi:MAG: M56 family metallopeptidase [Clostridia bacterium]|nr:M56 family metallopeptidase [Clostridia bacterium]
MKEFLLELFCISLPTTVVILLLSALSGGIKKTFSATCRYIIWLVVIIRLAIPLGGQLLPSLIEIPIYENVSGTGEDEEVKAPAPSAPITDNSRPTPDTTPSSPIPEGSDGSSYAPDAITPETGAAPESPILDKGEPEEEKTLEFEPSMLVPLLFFIWAGGAVAFVLSDVIGYSVFMARIKKTLVPADDRTKALYEELCSKLNVKSPPPLYVSAESSSPMLCGYIKRRIILPDMPLSDEAKAMVLAHELCHYRRGDLWAKLLARIANAIHWFNPAAYLASSHFNREMELSCDDRVISALSDEERLTYGQTMLDIVRNCRGGGTALTTKFNPKKKAAGERISNIVDWKKKKRGIVIICIVAALCIVAGVIIGIKTVSDNDSDGDTDDFTVSLYHAMDSYRICGKEGIKGKGPLKLLIDEETEIYFEGLYGAVYSSSHDDYNGDGIKDHCFSATVNSDNGCKSELYIFDGKTLEMLPYTPAKDVSVENSVKLYGNDEFYCIEIGDEVTGVSKSKLSDMADSLPDAPIARLYGFDIRAGAPVLKFNVIIIPKNGSASDEKSIGALIVPYEYDGKMLSAKESGVKFEKDSFSHGIFEEYATVITKGESFTLYATNEKAKNGGENEPLKLSLKDTSILFEGSYTSAVGTETEYYNVDVTGDSVSDHIIILPGSDDDGASKKEIHVFDGNTLREKKFDDSYEYVSDHVTLSSDEHTYFVKTDDSSLVREYSCYKRLFASFGTENHSDNVLIDSSCSGFVVDENSIRVKHNIHLENNKNEIIGIVSAHCNFSKEENKFICNSFSFYFTGIKNDRYNEWYARQNLIKYTSSI